MEDIYSIRVKTKPDTRNLYPSERRYSASTVSGLAWVHLALAATSFLLACLAIVNPVGGGNLAHLTLDDAKQSVVDQIEFVSNITLESNLETHESMQVASDVQKGIFEIKNDKEMNNSQSTSSGTHNDDSSKENEKQKRSNDAREMANEYSWILVISPSLLTISALAAGIASLMASSRWYVDRNISWLFLMSILSTTMSIIAFVMIVTWIATMTEVNLTQFYKDRVPFEDFVVVHKSIIVDHNDSHIVIANDTDPYGEVKERPVAKRVLSINILIACFLEFIWSILSLKIAYKGMKSTYKEDEEVRGGNCLVVTTIKGNNTKNLVRNAKVIPKPDLISHYPTNNNIKRFLSQDGNLNRDEKAGQPVNESGSEYRERMINFLNRCASFDGNDTNTEFQTPSVQSDVVLSTIVERSDVETRSERTPSVEDRISTISWGDPHDHTIYNQNNLDLDKILKGNMTSKPNNKVKHGNDNSNHDNDNVENDNDKLDTADENNEEVANDSNTSKGGDASIGAEKTSDSDS